MENVTIGARAGNKVHGNLYSCRFFFVPQLYGNKCYSKETGIS